MGSGFMGCAKKSGRWLTTEKDGGWVVQTWGMSLNGEFDPLPPRKWFEDFHRTLRTLLSRRRGGPLDLRKGPGRCRGRGAVPMKEKNTRRVSAAGAGVERVQKKMIEVIYCTLLTIL